MEVTVTFTVDTDSEIHAIEVVRHYLSSKGVHEKGEEKRDGKVIDKWWGYDTIETSQAK